MSTTRKLLNSPTVILAITVSCLLLESGWQVYISEVTNASCMHSSCTQPSDFVHFPLWLFIAPAATSLLGSALFIGALQDKLGDLSLTKKFLLTLMLGTWLFVLQWGVAFGLFLLTSHASISY
ncbi:MAG TPA: hypothetical protein VLG47_04200 [Candidatus Saccharimonadales bacterium]|nr:hypothetical protein [Candidatus Saccharimonadales bacterium]